MKNTEKKNSKVSKAKQKKNPNNGPKRQLTHLVPWNTLSYNDRIWKGHHKSGQKGENPWGYFCANPPLLPGDRIGRRPNDIRHQADQRGAQKDVLQAKEGAI